MGRKNLVVTSSIKNYLELMRINYWFKNIFVIPGIFFSYFLVAKVDLNFFFLKKILVAFFSIFSACSANYVINEITDSKFDRFHKDKKNRPIVTGAIKKTNAIFLFFMLIFISLYLSLKINIFFSLLIAILLVSGIFYNLEPLRLKDIPILDVISESFNNFLRLLLGWSIFHPGYLPPISLCIIFWSGGAFLMFMKRYAEYNFLSSKKISSLYRKSFAFYNSQNLMSLGVSSAFVCCVFIGIFLVKYKIEFILLIPFVVGVFGHYTYISMLKNSKAQSPEYLYQDKTLVFLIICIFILLNILLNSKFAFLEIFNFGIIKNNFIK